MSEWKQRFEKMRFDPKHHLGMGDIRLTVGQQEEVLADLREWISVEDRLPENYNSVLVYSENGTEDVEYGFHTESGGWLVYSPNSEHGVDHKEISHWQPLPAAPPGEEE